MKKIKIALAALTITTGSIFTVKASLFGSGSVYCETPSSTTCTHKIDFKVDASGVTTLPCASPAVAKIFTYCGGTWTCVQLPTTAKFIATALAK